MLVAVASLSACSQRAGDLGRQPNDYYTRNVFDRVDRHLLAGGRADLSQLPYADEEEHMYDVLWRFFSAPHAYEWSPFGKSRVNPPDLKNGKAFEKTDKYYSYLRWAGFESSRVRYATIAHHISNDLGTLPRAFAAVCAVKKLDSQRQTASASFPEFGEDQQRELELRLIENANAALIFGYALEYRYESYTYALKRLLVETPDEAARDVDTKLSELAIWVEQAGRQAYCG